MENFTTSFWLPADNFIADRQSVRLLFSLRCALKLMHIIVARRRQDRRGLAECGIKGRMDMRALQRLEQMAAQQQRQQLCRREGERRHFSESGRQPPPPRPRSP